MSENDPNDMPEPKEGHRLSRRDLLRYTGTLAVASLAAPVLAACGGSTASPTAASSAAPSTAASMAPSAAPSAAASTAPSASPTAAMSSPLGYVARTDVKGDITFWHFWSSPVRRTAVRRIITDFQQTYPNIKVTEQAVPFGEIWTKNIAAVTAGSGMPDVIVEDRPQLRTRAQNNIDASLADMASRDQVSGEQFWPFTWQEAVIDNKPYGLPYETDIRVLYYNKAAFKDAGLDPEKPPQNWDDLWAYSDKLDVKSGGKLERIGFYPLIGSMGLDQWAWNNGGEWQDKAGNPTLNAKPNVEALEWIKKWTDRYGGKEKLDAFRSSFGQGNQDAFMGGKVAMIVDIQGYTSFLNFFNAKFETKGDKPENLGYGVAKIPPAKGQKPASFSGGFALSIPRGVKQTDAAWEFIKYMTFKGQASWARDTYGMPTVQKIAKTDPVLQQSPNWTFFVEAMSYGRPGVYNPNYPSMLEVLGPATDAVLAGQKTAQQALDEAQKKAEQEIARNKK